MAGGRIAGITVVLDGDATKLNAALKSVDTQIKTTQGQLKDINKLLKLDPGNTELLTQKQKYLGEALGATRDRLKELENVKLNNLDQLNDVQLDALNREIEETRIKLRDLESQGATTSKALQGLNVAGAKMQTFGNQVSNVGKQLLPVSVALAAVGTAAVTNFAEVDKTMQLTNKTMQNTEEEAALLSKAMKEAAMNSTFNMSEAAEATLNFARAGLTAEEAAAALAPAMALAAGEGGNLATVSQGLVGAINGFGDSFNNTAHYADVLANACNNSALDIDSLANSIGTAVPIFATAGYSIEDVALALGVMADKNISADVAANSLKTGLARLVSPAKQGAEAMEALGISVTNADGSMKEFTQIQRELHDAFTGLSESEQMAAASAIFGKNQMSSWLALINTAPEDVEALNSKLRETGTAMEMSDAMMEGFGGSLEKLKSTLDVAASTLGEALAPTIQELAEWISKLIEKFIALDPETQQFIAKLGLIVTAAAPLLIIGGKLISGIGTILTLIPKTITFLGEIPGTITSITSGIGGLVGKLGGLGTALSGAGTAATEAAASAGTAASGLAGLGANALWVAGPLGAIFAGFGIGIKQGIDDIKAFNAELAVQYQTVSEAQAAIESYNQQIAQQQIDLENMKRYGLEGTIEAEDRLLELQALLAEAQRQHAALLEAEQSKTTDLTGQLDENTGAVEENSDALKEANSSLEETATGTKEAATEALTEISETTAETCETMAEATEKTEETCNSIAESFNKLKETLTTTFEELKTLITTTWDEIKATISGGGEEGGGLGIAEKFTEMGTTIQTAIEGWSVNITAALETIKVSFTTAWTEIMTFLTTTWTTIQTTATTVWTAIQTFYTTFWLNMTTLTTTSMTTISTTMNESWTLIIEFVTAQLTALLEITTTTFNQITALITTGMAQIVATIKTAANQITATIRTLVNSAYGWGADFVGGFQAGILSRMYALLATVRNMAAQIASYLHFSEPDRGPLSNYHTWMPDFMKGLADDINRNKYLVEDAISKVAGNMTIHPQLALAQVAGGYGGGAKNTMSHTGTIRVQGVNDREQVAAIVDIVIDQLRQEVRT